MQFLLFFKFPIAYKAYLNTKLVNFPEIIIKILQNEFINIFCVKC